MHLEHRNWSRKVSRRAGISSSGFLASFDIVSDQLFTLLTAIIILERVTICQVNLLNVLVRYFTVFLPAAKHAGQWIMIGLL